MYLSEFISKHLEYDFPIVDCATVCKMCGKFIKRGVKEADIIKKSTFTDYQYVKYNSRFVCAECSALIGQITVNGKQTWLRNFSFICNQDNLTILKRDQIWKYIFDPPETPFVFCVTYSNKKHIAFKSSIQYDSKHYNVFTDKGSVNIMPDELARIANIIQQWYTILHDKRQTKQQPTWFNKSEILSGGKNHKNITRYGLMKYVAENQFIDKYRNTALLKLLVFALNKTECHS